MRPYTLGIDLHKRSSVWVLLDGEGNEIWKDSVPCHPDHITKTLKWMPASGTDVQAALEPTCGWRWVAALLEEAGIEVHPARCVRPIGKQSAKLVIGDRGGIRLNKCGPIFCCGSNKRLTTPPRVYSNA